MTEETRSPDAVEEIEQPDIETRIAEKVRYDSRERSRLTGVDAIETLFTDDDPDVQFAEMTQKEQFADIKWVVAEGGATYFYSDQFLTTDVATRESAIEQAITSIVEQVRAESKEIKLTPLETVQAQLPEELADDVDLVLDRIAELPQNEDIARVAGPAAVYLHSLTHISGSYARMMARSEGDDPCWTIADTVREESQVYPRPTFVGLFTEKVFGIDVDKLNDYVAEVLQREEFSDIKKVVASNGDEYLYSDQYLNEKLAQSRAEFFSVEQFEAQ